MTRLDDAGTSARCVKGKGKLLITWWYKRTLSSWLKSSTSQTPKELKGKVSLAIIKLK